MLKTIKEDCRDLNDDPVLDLCSGCQLDLANEEISEKEQELYRRRETLECYMLSAQEEIKDIEA